MTYKLYGNGKKEGMYFDFSYEGLYSFIDISQKAIMMPSPKDTKGPIVKTGPTAGQNRSRNESGEWRKKRSDAGKPRAK